MPRPLREFNATDSHDAVECKHNEASTSFDYTRFLAGSRLKSEETHAAAITENYSSSSNEIQAREEVRREQYDQEQHSKDPADKVILRKDNIAAGSGKGEGPGYNQDFRVEDQDGYFDDNFRIGDQDDNFFKNCIDSLIDGKQRVTINLVQDKLLSHIKTQAQADQCISYLDQQYTSAYETIANRVRNIKKYIKGHRKQFDN